MNRIPDQRDWRGGFFERLTDRFIFESTREGLGLDGEYAYQQFFGKSDVEAFEMFCDDALSREEDLRWMPFKCFQYYIHPYIDYLQSDSARGDSLGAIAFFGLINGRLHEILRANDQLRARIVEVLEFLGSRQEWFDAEVPIGSFSNQAENLLSKLKCKPD